MTAIPDNLEPYGARASRFPGPPLHGAVVTTRLRMDGRAGDRMGGHHRQKPDWRPVVAPTPWDLSIGHRPCARNAGRRPDRAWGVDDLPSLIILGFALLLIVYSLIGGNESIFLATFIGLPFLLLGIVALIDRRRRAPVVGPGFVTPEIGLDRHGGIITVLRASPQFVSAARELARPQIQPVPDASPGTVQATSPPNGFGGATPAAHAPPSQEAPAGTGTAPGTPSWPLPAAERATDAPPPWWSS